MLTICCLIRKSSAPRSTASDADVLVRLSDKHDDRLQPGLRLQAQKCREPEAVGQVEVEQDDVEVPLPQQRETLGEAARDFERERLVAHQCKLFTEQTLVVRVRVDQQNCRIRHAGGEYKAAA